MFGKVSTLVIMMFFLFYFFFFTVSILLSWSGTLSKFSQSFANITNFNNGTCVTLYLIQGFSHWLLNALPLQIISTQDWRSCFFKIILFTTQIWKRLWRYANSWQSEMMFRNILEPDKMSPSPYLLDTMEVKWLFLKYFPMWTTFSFTSETSPSWSSKCKLYVELPQVNTCSSFLFSHLLTLGALSVTILPTWQP